MSDALQSLQNLLKGTASTSIFQRVMGTTSVVAPAPKNEIKVKVPVVEEKKAIKKPKMRIGFGVSSGVSSVTQPKQSQPEAKGEDVKVKPKREAPTLPITFPVEILETNAKRENDKQEEWRAKAKQANGFSREQSKAAFQEWTALIAKQDAIQATLNRMSAEAKKRQTEAKVAEIDALERAMAAEAAHVRPPHQTPLQTPVHHPDMHVGDQVIQEDNEEDIPLPSFGVKSSAPSVTQAETLGANTQDEVVDEPILELNLPKPLVVVEEPPVVDEEPPVVDEDGCQDGRPVELEHVQPKIVPSENPTLNDENTARTVDLSSANTRPLTLGSPSNYDGTDDARVVHFSDEKPDEKKIKGFDYDTMNKEEAKTRWETCDRARGTRVSVVQLKAYCTALGLTFVTPKRDTFAMIKEYFKANESRE